MCCTPPVDDVAPRAERPSNRIHRRGPQQRRLSAAEPAVARPVGTGAARADKERLTAWLSVAPTEAGSLPGRRPARSRRLPAPSRSGTDRRPWSASTRSRPGIGRHDAAHHRADRALRTGPRRRQRRNRRMTVASTDGSNEANRPAPEPYGHWGRPGARPRRPAARPTPRQPAGRCRRVPPCRW